MLSRREASVQFIERAIVETRHPVDLKQKIAECVLVAEVCAKPRTKKMLWQVAALDRPGP